MLNTFCFLRVEMCKMKVTGENDMIYLKKENKNNTETMLTLLFDIFKIWYLQIDIPIRNDIF